LRICKVETIKFKLINKNLKFKVTIFFMKNSSLFLKICFVFYFCFDCKVGAQDLSNQLTLSPLFSDHMVLQQKKAVTFWGKSSPNNIIKVNASWGETNSIISDSKGNWELKLLTPAAGGHMR
jgi:hypothetical protein